MTWAFYPRSFDGLISRLYFLMIQILGIFKIRTYDWIAYRWHLSALYNTGAIMILHFVDCRYLLTFLIFSALPGTQIESRRDSNLKTLEKLSDFMNFFDLLAKAVVTRYVGKQTLGVWIIMGTPGITYNKKA